MDGYLMALDAGTGSVRAVIFDMAGAQVGAAAREWEHREDPRWPGSMDFDWRAGWDLTCACIREVLESTGVAPGGIKAVSTTCMREGIVLYDRAGEEIWACANVDARADDEVGQLIALDPGLEKEIYTLSGQTYALGALPRLLWVKNKQPELYEKMAKVSMFNDWLIYKLTGELYTEPSNGSTTGIFDLEKRSWLPEIAARCGLRADIFPTVRECGLAVGEVSDKAAGETSLAPGTLVATGGGDAQLGCVGVGAVQPGQAAVFGGSFWQYEYNTDVAKTDSQCRVRVNCHALPGLWQYEALAFKPGLAMRWYRDAFCQLEKQQADADGLDPYVLMDREAEKIPAGCWGMQCTFSDVMNYIGWKHASPTFTNFDFDPVKYNRFTFYRAIMENTALVTLGHLRLVQEATGHAPDNVVFAGGAAKSPLWSQILADVLGLPVQVPAVKEATALGGAVLAGHAAGIWPDVAAAAKNLVKMERTFKPDAANHAVYAEMYEQWRRVYAAQLALSNEGTTRYMWCAPGI